MFLFRAIGRLYTYSNSWMERCNLRINNKPRPLWCGNREIIDLIFGKDHASIFYKRVKKIGCRHFHIYKPCNTLFGVSICVSNTSVENVEYLHISLEYVSKIFLLLKTVMNTIFIFFICLWNFCFLYKATPTSFNNIYLINPVDLFKWPFVKLFPGHTG